MGPSISLQNVSLAIDGNRILEPLSIELAAGQLHMLVGPNGAGKTTLLKSMLGLMPHRGMIQRHWPGATQRPAYIPQQPRFEQVLPVTVEDFLTAGITSMPVFLRPLTRLRPQLDRLLQQVGLEQKGVLPLGKLSGGERQRLMFAQALSYESDLWFMDEPLTGLDTEGQQLITELILSLRAAGKTLIVVHHDHEFVRAHADNVLVIDNGLQWTGRADQWGQSVEAKLQTSSVGEVA